MVNLYDYNFEECNILRLSVAINTVRMVFVCVSKSPANNINDYTQNLCDYMARFRGILNSEKSDNDYTDVIGDKILTFMVELIMIILIGWLNMVLNPL